MKHNEVQIKDRYGNLSSMFYDPYTDPEVVTLLERYYERNTRIRLFYGDTDSPDFEQIHNRKPDPGHTWDDEYMVSGYIGRSTGPKKIPLLIHNSRSLGGGAILTGCIVRIIVDGRIVYSHPNYHNDFDSAEVVRSELWPEYSHAVKPTTGEWAGQEIARFKSERAAKNYLAFMQGKRMCK